MERRIRLLEKRVRRLSGLAAGLALALATMVVLGVSGREELVVERLVVVDGEGRPRIVVGADAEDVGRISSATGITLFDRTGAERGGFSVLDDGSVVLGLDAPAGVGSPMRDRVALKVYPSGAAAISVIGNDTGIPVQMVGDASGEGGLEFLDYDLAQRIAIVKRLHFDGKSVREVPLDPPASREK